MSPTVQLIDAQPLRHLVSQPPATAARPAEGWPLACFLHGYDEAAPTELRAALTRHGPLRPATPSLAGRCVVVAPQLPTAGDVWYRWSDAVRAIVDRVEREQGTDPRRRHLTGFSFGGNGVFDLALLQPATWAALWAVDPTRAPARAIVEPVWLSVGDIARRRLDAFVTALGLRDAGAVDGDPGDRAYLDQGGDHVASATMAYGDPRVHEWLLARRLPGAG